MREAKRRIGKKRTDAGPSATTTWLSSLQNVLLPSQTSNIGYALPRMQNILKQVSVIPFFYVHSCTSFLMTPFSDNHRLCISWRAPQEA